MADEICVSAVAQGALGLEARSDGNVRERLAFLNDAATCAEIAAERALLDRLNGGCHVPIGARARVAGEQISMIGVVASPDGKNLCRSEIFGSVKEAADLGKRLAEQLLERGAGELLANI